MLLSNSKFEVSILRRDVQYGGSTQMTFRSLKASSLLLLICALHPLVQLDPVTISTLIYISSVKYALFAGRLCPLHPVETVEQC